MNEFFSLPWTPHIFHMNSLSCLHQSFARVSRASKERSLQTGHNFSTEAASFSRAVFSGHSFCGICEDYLHAYIRGLWKLKETPMSYVIAKLLRMRMRYQSHTCVNIFTFLYIQNYNIKLKKITGLNFQCSDSSSLVEYEYEGNVFSIRLN